MSPSLAVNRKRAPSSQSTNIYGMHTLFGLVLIAAASVVIARPPGPGSTTASQEELPLHSPSRKYLKDYILSRFLWPHYFSFEEDPPEAVNLHREHMPATEWLNQEIERLSRIHIGHKPEIPRRMLRAPSYFKRWPTPYNIRSHIQPYYANEPWPVRNLPIENLIQRDLETNELNREPDLTEPLSEENKKKEFALTPRDEGYFDPDEPRNHSVNLTSEKERVGVPGGPHEGGRVITHPELEPEPPRQIRQNPMSRTKTLIADNLDNLRTGLGHEDAGPKNSPQLVGIMEPTSLDSPGSFYGVALLSAIGAAAVLAIVGFGFGWYTLSKRAKLAADVDYPAYGVTGPTVDPSGDRKLAHSAHMYHYQHQKQQIIAMERSGMEPQSGSVSDPESDDENEEGDYTVYECPGFATTGDMEVKNPLFNEDPTPATPGKCEVVKPQPKD